MKRRLPLPVFNAVDTDFFIDILMSETLPSMSEFYPSVVKGIFVSSDMAIESVDTRGIVNRTSKYVIPMVDDLYPYTGISTFNYPRNFLGGGTYSNPGAIDAFSSKIIASMNPPDVRFTASFEDPNIIEITPPPKIHMDFSVSMYRVRRLEEIKTGLHEQFKKLFEADCKIAMYYKFYTLVDGGAFGGVNLKDFVSDFRDYQSIRDDIYEDMAKEYFKDPDRYDEMFNYSGVD